MFVNSCSYMTISFIYNITSCFILLILEFSPIRLHGRHLVIAPRLRYHGPVLC